MSYSGATGQTRFSGSVVLAGRSASGGVGQLISVRYILCLSKLGVVVSGKSRRACLYTFHSCIFVSES